MNPPRKSRLSAVRNHELEKRLSKSGIPKPCRKGSADRISGVHPIDQIDRSAMKVSFSSSRRISRSAESVRNTIGSHLKPRSESVQRPGSTFRPRSTVASNWETPNSRLTRDYLQTPMSGLSINSCRHSNFRTPLSERNDSPKHILEQALRAVPIKDKRIVTKIPWQQATSSRIVAKLKEDSSISACLSGSHAPLKPITIKLFLDVTNHLLSKFGGVRFQVDSNNYIEKLPNVARKLLYPGIMTKSWLKSVNAMHTYPHVLAFLSYLVDLAEANEIIEHNMDLGRLYGADEKGQLLALRHEYYFKTWKMLAHQNVQENLESVADEYLYEFQNLNNFSEEEFNIHEKEFLALKEEKNRLMKHMEELKSRRANSELISLKEKECYVKQLLNRLNSEINESKKKHDDMKTELDMAVQLVEKFRDQVKFIEDVISKQGMNVNKRDSCLHQIKISEEIINSKEEVLKEIKKLNFDRDLTLAAAQRKALDLSIAVNKKVANVGVIAGKPLTKYSIMERELLTPGPIDTIKKTNEELKEFIVQAESQLQKIMEQSDHKKTNQSQLHTQIEVMKDHALTLKNTQEILESSIKEKQYLIAMLNKKREQAQINVNSAMILKDKEQKSLGEIKEQFDDWKDQDTKWRKKNAQLRSEESSVHESCKKRAELLLLEYVAIANTVFEKNNGVF